MARERQDFYFWAGETVNVIIDVFDKKGDPVNIEGSKVEFAVAYHRLSEDKLMEKTTEEPGQIDIENNRIIIHVGPSDSEQFQDEAKLYHETKVTDANNNQNVVTVGSVVINPSVFI